MQQGTHSALSSLLSSTIVSATLESSSVMENTSFSSSDEVHQQTSTVSTGDILPCSDAGDISRLAFSSVPSSSHTSEILDVDETSETFRKCNSLIQQLLQRVQPSVESERHRKEVFDIISSALEMANLKVNNLHCILLILEDVFVWVGGIQDVFT